MGNENLGPSYDPTLRSSSSKGKEYLFHDGFHKSFGHGFDCHGYYKAIRIVKSVLQDLY